MSENNDSQMMINDMKGSELEESIRKLSSISENQFETVKHEKWYIRLWDTITFSNKGEIRLAEQISTLAQAQQIVAQYLLKASQQNKEISDLVKNNATYIKKLAGQSVSFKKDLTSIKNLILLLNEINNGLYNNFKPITSMCSILSQLDNDVLSDARSLNNILLSLNNHGVLNGESIEVIDFLMDIADMPEAEMPLVYTELSTIRENYYANLALSVIDGQYFSDNNSRSKDDIVLDVAIVHSVEKKYDSTNLNSIFVSFLNSVISEKVSAGEFSITNPSAKQEREEAEKLFYAGKLIEAYPKFVHAADSGDARACYFTACYYFSGYGTTAKNEEFYKKYIDLGINRRDPFCYLEYSRYLYNHGEKNKAEYWRNKILPQVGKLADKGDPVACYLIATVMLVYFMDEYSAIGDRTDWTEEEKKKLGITSGVYRNYLTKAIEAGYWPAAFSKCFTLGVILDGSDREDNIKKYGWMFENVEYADVQSMLGNRFLGLDTTENKYYKNAAVCFAKAYSLQKSDSLSGYMAFFLKAGLGRDLLSTELEGSDVSLLYYKGLNSDEPTSLHGLGDLYYFGVSNKHLGLDRVAAFEHYVKAYEKYDSVKDFPGKERFDTGKSSVAYMLGYMTSFGIGTEKNMKKAVRYYQNAVQNGDKRAIKPLAECYLNGTGTEKDVKRYNELIAMLNDE